MRALETGLGLPLSPEEGVSQTGWVEVDGTIWDMQWVQLGYARGVCVGVICWKYPLSVPPVLLPANTAQFSLTPGKPSLQRGDCCMR